MELKCQNCDEKYILGKDAISITSEELMEMMPFVIGQMPKSLQVGHPKDGNQNDELLREAQSTIMRLGPERGWTCDKCHYTNFWKY